MDTSKQRGDWAEQLACQHVSQHGWHIIQRNFHCHGGELDLIATKHNTLAFIEVKYRRSGAFGGPLASITASKRRRLIRTAQVFLQRHPQWQSHHCRFDLLAISGRPQLQLKLQWLPSIFSLTE